MSVEILGNNEYDDVPLLDATAITWLEAANQCDPLFQDLALSGLSAVYHGVKASDESSALDSLALGDLFDDTGNFLADNLYKKITAGWYPKAPHVDTFSAGIHVTKAVMTASRLFKTLPVVNTDYEGQTGVKFVQRRLLVPVSDPQDAGNALNTYPVRNVQVRVFTEDYPNPRRKYTEIDFAAALYGAGELPWSTTITLGGGTDTRQETARARVSSGSRQGDFVRSHAHSSFSELSQYARVIEANI